MTPHRSTNTKPRRGAAGTKWYCALWGSLLGKTGGRARTMRYAAKRDSNDKLITEALRKAGFEVHDLGLAGHGVPDKLVTRMLPDGTPWAAFVEIKSPKGKLRPGQELWQKVFEPQLMWYLARDPEETINFLWRSYSGSLKPEWYG